VRSIACLQRVSRDRWGATVAFHPLFDAHRGR
jgi:hypothetical protein